MPPFKSVSFPAKKQFVQCSYLPHTDKLSQFSSQPLPIHSDGIYQFSVWWIHYNHCNAVNLPDKELVNLTFVQYSTPLLAHFSRSTIQIMTKVSFSRCLHYGWNLAVMSVAQGSRLKSFDFTTNTIILNNS